MTEPEAASQTPPAEHAPERPGLAEPADSPQQDRESEDLEYARRVYHNKVEIHFHDEVDASEAVFGIAAAGQDRTSSRRVTGRLNKHDIAATLRWFVAPPAFRPACQALLDRRLVVLVADEGCGRRTGALALLRRVVGDAAPMTSFSPALTFGQLAAKVTFEAGVGYLVADHIGDGEAAPVREFEATRLADRLRQADAYLVVTATHAVISRRTLRQFLIEWGIPDACDLFDQCVRGAAVDADILIQARTRAGQLQTPHEVVDLARGLVEDPRGALRALEDSAADQVAGWFSSEPSTRDVLAIAALTFLHGLPERVFESHLAQLLEFAEVAPSRNAPAQRWPDGGLTQRRIGFARDHVLATTERATVAGCVGPVTERVVVFRSAQHRDRVIAELHDRYGHELWEPLRLWLHDMARNASPEVRVESARGLATLARIAFGQVAELIDEWANSEAAPARLTAAITLWWMCAEDALVPMALRTATRWVHNRGQHRAMTAAIAFGGDLGLRYQSDALRWLWFLARRAERIGVVARLSIAFLFSSAVDDPASCRSALAFAANELRQAAADDTDGRAVRAMRRAVVTMLRAPHPGADELAVVTVIRHQPENLGHLGVLWADVLRSAPHRQDAYEALVQSLSSMSPDQQENVRLLGTAVLSDMPEAHRTILRRDLAHTTHDPNFVRRPPQELVSALLTALDRSKGTRTVHIVRGGEQQ